MADILLFHAQAAGNWLQEHKPVAAAGAVVIGTGATVQLVRRLYSVHKLRQVRLKKIKQREEALDRWIKRVNSDSVPEEVCKKITSLSVDELSKKIRGGEISAKEALRAYQQKAILAHNVTNCIVEPIWEAEEWADELDKRKDKKGLLFGVPVSIKDNYGIKGYDSCVGCTRWMDDPRQEDCVNVRVMKLEGAVPFVKTTVPQTMMSLETSSPTFGQTRNPYDPNRISGGSSGGESALLAMKGSPLGFGSDIGGSIRFPCHCTGVMGIKPTAQRTSHEGMRTASSGQNLVQPGYGPMSTDIDNLVTGFKVLVHEQVFKSDARVAPVPFNDKLYQSKNKLKIAYYTDDGFFACSPVCKRAALEAKEALEGLGYELVPFDVKRFSEKAILYYMSCISSDCGVGVSKCLKDDTVDHAIRTQLTMYLLPRSVKRVMDLLLRIFGYSKMARVLLHTVGFDSVYQWQQFVVEVELFRKEMRDYITSNGIDAVIGPSFCIPAPTIKTWSKATGMGSYTFLYNVADFPTGSMPVTKVTQADQDAMADYPESDPWHKAAKKSSEKGTVGLPVNVTIAALPWKEELCLRLMRELQGALNKK